MEETQVKSKKRKAGSEDFRRTSAACPCSYKHRKGAYALGTSLEDLSLFDMAITPCPSGRHTMHLSMLRLLIQALEAAPNRWYYYWGGAGSILSDWLPPDDSEIEAPEVYCELKDMMDGFEENLAYVQERSIEVLGQSTQTWWSQIDGKDLGRRMNELGDFSDWSFYEHKTDMWLSRVVHDMAKLDNFESISKTRDTSLTTFDKDEVYGYCDEAASALRTQMLRLVTYYESHSDYIRFIRQITKDLKSTIEACDAKVAS